MTTRLLIVSDTHLSPRTPEATTNWDAVVDHVEATGPDLVVHAGDVAVDGPGHPEDLAYAHEQLGRLRCRVLVVPGNHDVGENGDVTRESLGRYKAAFGPDRWSLDLPGWRLVGIDALLFGSGLDDEAEQWAWLAELSRPTPTPRRVALVLHKPFAAPPRHPADAKPTRYVAPAARKWLQAMFADTSLDVVVSGHVHQYGRFGDRDDATTSVWAPSTWAIIPDRVQPVLADKVCGAVEISLPADGRVDIQLCRPAGLVQHVLDETVKNPYG